MLLLYLAAAWVLGITLAAFLALPTLVWGLLLVLPVGYLVLWWRDPDLRRVHFILFALVLGALRYQLALPSPADRALAAFNDRGRVSLVGIVAAEPERFDAYTNLRVDVIRLQSGGAWREVRGRALVQAPRDAPVRYGDEIQVDGAPTAPPDGADFSYRDFLARAAIFTEVPYAVVFVLSHDHGNVLWVRLLEFKAAALDAVATLLPEPSAALLQGILLGDDHNIPRALQEAFNRTNTAHIIAISGYNIAIIALYLGLVAPRLVGKRLADWFILAALLGYTLLVGAGASVVRAAIMGGLAVIALHYGRQTYALISLAAAALLMTLLNPFTLWDAGFQLSFLATLGLILFLQPLTAGVESLVRRIAGRARARPIVSFLGDSLIVTVAAQITTTPLVIALFHRLSLVGLLTNFLILPAQPGIEILGGLATLVRLLAFLLAPFPVAAVLLGAVAQVLAWGAYLFLQFTILVVQWTAQVPFGYFTVPPVDPLLVAFAYLLLFLLPRLPFRRLAGLVFSRPAWAAGALALATVLIWAASLAAPDPRTHFQFLATSGGDALLIRTAGGARVLIDGSAEPSALLAHLGSQSPFWDKRLDLLVATNLDEQNLASLNAVLERYRVGQVLEPPLAERTTDGYRKWRSLLDSRAVPPVHAQAGTQLQVDELNLEVLHPPADGSSTNVALRLAAGSHTVLFAPALRAADLDALAHGESDLTSEIAVLPRAFGPEFLERVAPGSVLFFVGGPREQPAPEALKLLSGVSVLRTDERGTVEFILDRDQVRVQTER